MERSIKKNGDSDIAKKGLFMKTDTIDQGDFFKFGWLKTKKFIGYFCCLFLVIFAMNAALSFFKGSLGASSGGQFLYDALSFFIDIIVGLGMTRVVIEICDEHTPDMSAFFFNFRFFLNYAAGSILFMLMITLGFILLIIPGIICFLKFQFFAYFIIDKNAGPFEAFKMSSRITKGIKMRLLAFLILAGGINILGGLALGIGLIASIPTTLIAHAAIYRKLSSDSFNRGQPRHQY